MVAQDALRAGLVDKLLNHDEVLDELKTLAGKGSKDKDFPQIAMEDYVKIPDTAKGKNRIAVVYAEGGIVDGEGPGQVGGDRLSRELRRLRLDSGVKAIVLRVNSPGGSALASELIQRELVVTRKAGKPVVVSMGTVAASGGYWISIFSDRIFAEPNTITGSIGVVGMIPSIKKLANEHGVTWDSVQMAKLGIPGLSRPATPEELKRTQDMVDEVYDLFLTKVAEGRNLPKDKVHEIAQGRVWSGKEALNLKLVDELGGLQDAVKCAAKLAKIENDYRVDSPTPPKSPMENLMKAFGGGEKRKLVRSSGPAEQLKAGLEQAYRKLELLSDPRGIYAVMPYEITIR
jgi:protease-4